jgi:hypothetical protein
LLQADPTPENKKKLTEQIKVLKQIKDELRAHTALSEAQ